MPRIGQLLSALLVALIGVLVVQMFLIAGMQQRLTTTERTPAIDAVQLPAPAADPPLAAAPISADAAPPPATTSTLVIVITAGDPAPAPPAPATMLDLPEPAANEPPAQRDGGKALIERFIELTGKPLGTVPFAQEAAS
jgi:hypothetical protein